MPSSSFSRTPSSTGNRKTWTFSTWVKRSGLGSIGGQSKTLIRVGQNDQLRFDTSDRLDWYTNNATYRLVTTQVFRDTNAWYHIVITCDTTQGTASDRMKIYVNGQQVTSFSTSNYPTQNFDTDVNNTTATGIGYAPLTTDEWLYGSLSHTNLIDGTAYDASAFGETDATTGIWKPKTNPSVTYGTNGFFLKFENSGSMGTDSSGNTNNFTVNGTPTQTVDTPSNVFATWNATLAMNSTMTLANGNTTGTTGLSYSAGASNSWFSTLGVTKGKYYAEFKVSAFTGGDAGMVGVAYDLSIAQQGSTANAFNIAYLSATGGTAYQMIGVIRYNATDLISSLPTYTTNDIIGVALDLDNHKLYFHKNGTYVNGGDPTSGATGTGSVRNLETGQEYFFGCSDGSSTNTYTYQANFGNGYFGTTAVASGNADDNGLGIFEYAPPTGYLALCTKNINSQEYA